MKRCPQCNRVETDDTLTFCRADGTALISDSGPVSADAGKVKFNSATVASEIATSVLPQTITDAGIGLPTAPTTVLPAPPLSGVVADSGAARVDEGFWIAVLPFKHRGSNADLEALAGLSEDIVTELSRFSYLRVISQPSLNDHEGGGCVRFAVLDTFPD